EVRAALATKLLQRNGDMRRILLEEGTGVVEALTAIRGPLFGLSAPPIRGMIRGDAASGVGGLAAGSARSCEDAKEALCGKNGACGDPTEVNNNFSVAHPRRGLERSPALRPAPAPMPRVFPLRAREETRESRGMPCLFLNTERSFGGKPPKKSGFRRHLAGSKMPKETFFTAISRWRVVSRRTLDASGFWQG